MRSERILTSFLFGLILVGYGCAPNDGGIKGHVDQSWRFGVVCRALPSCDGAM